MTGAPDRARWSTAMLGMLAVACGDPPPGGSGTGGSSSGGGATATTTGGSGSSASLDSSGEGSSGEPMEDESCFALEWEWLETIESSGLAIVRGDTVGVLDVDDRSATTRLTGLMPDGSVSFGPVVISDQRGGKLSVSTDGEWWTLVHGPTDGDDRLQRWSADGDAIDEVPVAVFPGEPGVARSMALHPEGGAVIGGDVADLAFGQVNLVRVADDGSAQWDLAGDDHTTRRVLVDPAGTIYAMVISIQKEGADTYIDAFESDGTPLWSELVGSHGGFGDEHQAPFDLSFDGEGGFIAVGSDRKPGPGPAIFQGQVQRFDARGGSMWTAALDLEEEGDFATHGDVARVGDLAYVGLVVGSYSTLMRVDLEGNPLCLRQLRPEQRMHSMIAIGEDAVIVVGSQAMDERWFTRVARYRIALP